MECSDSYKRLNQFSSKTLEADLETCMSRFEFMKSKQKKYYETKNRGFKKKILVNDQRKIGYESKITVNVNKVKIMTKNRFEVLEEDFDSNNLSIFEAEEAEKICEEKQKRICLNDLKKCNMSRNAKQLQQSRIVKSEDRESSVVDDNILK